MKNLINSVGLYRIVSIVIWVFVLASLIWFVVFYIAESKDYSQGVARMRAGTQSAMNESLRPLNGIERLSATVTNGEDFSESFLCIDVACPQIESRWYVIESKERGDYLRQKIKKAIEEKSGRSKWDAYVIAGVLGKDERPYEPPMDKEWYNISVYVTYASYAPKR